jgi:hypothetical protein
MRCQLHVVFILVSTVFSVMTTSTTTTPFVYQNDATCGTWQRQYTELHRAILAGTAPIQQRAIAVSIDTGLNDRLIGIMMSFIYALLTDRAFQIETYGKTPPFEAAFEWPNIDWRRLPRDNDTVLGPLKFRDNVRREFPPEIDRRENAMLYLVNFNGAALDFWVRDDLRTTHGTENVTNVFVTSNRGRVFKVFSNRHHHRQLFHSGMRPDTALGCVWRFLFAPNEHVRHAMLREFTALSAVAPLKISVNIRVGDHVFKQERDAETKLEPFLDVFDCAAEIETFARAPMQSVVWYFTSDSLRLRQLVAERYGEKVLTDTTTTYVHGDCIVSCGDEQSQNTSLITAVGQLYAMTLCDYHVINRWSGFGRFGAWASNRYRHMYSFPRDSKSKCTVDAYDALEVSALEWTGIK